MKRYRIIKITYKLFFIILFFVFFAGFPSYAQNTGTLPLNDPNSVLKVLLSAINNYQLPLTGRGTATMRMENNIEDPDKIYSDKELFIDFVFKGPSSRTNIFETSNDAKKSRLLSEAITDKQDISFSPIFESAHIDGVQEHKRIGFDFHPEVFMYFSSGFLAELLKSAMKHPPDYASVELDTEGILHYIARGHLVQNGKGYDEEMKLSFDTRKGLLPVSYFMGNKYVDPNKDWGREAKFEWTKFGSTWYPTQAEYFVQPGKRKHVVFIVKDFTPNVDVPDADFTLDSMNIPDGTIISDSIVGIAYRYGTSPDFVENLEKPLKEADFTKKIETERSALINKDNNTNAYNELSMQDIRNINDVNSQQLKTVGQLDKHSLWRYGIIFICIATFIGAMAFLKYRTNS